MMEEPFFQLTLILLLETVLALESVVPFGLLTDAVLGETSTVSTVARDACAVEADASAAQA